MIIALKFADIQRQAKMTEMHISTQLRQALISTTVVGAFFGLLCALGSFAFYSEYGPKIADAPHDAYANILQAIGTFFWVTFFIVTAFGLLPSAIACALTRLFCKAPNSSSKQTRKRPPVA